MRRVFLALFFSIAFHTGFIALAIGVGWFRGRIALPSVTVKSIDIEVHSLPLGLPKSKVPAKEMGSPQPRRKALSRLAKTNTTVFLPVDGGIQSTDARSPREEAHRDASAATETTRDKPTDLRDYGPEGSTLVALLRIDRLRQSPAKDRYIAAIDQLLLHLPDRHRLIEGTNLDLFQDFDSLLIATPNPTNAAVTFLAVRHRLTDSALRKALSRGAATLGQAVEWKEIAGRPVGIRRRTKPNPHNSMDGDDRIFVLLQPTLAIMATPAHAKLLLGPDLRGGAQQGFQDLVAKIDAEDGAMPETAVFMLVANKLFSSTPNGEGASPDTTENRPLQITSNLPGPMPSVVTLLAGIDPAPTVDLIAEFSKDGEAHQWEQALPTWRRKAMRNPILLLMGISNLLNRIEVTQENNPLGLHLALTAEELQRLLTLIANLNRGAFQNPR
jgi:hypothetical protein